MLISDEIKMLNFININCYLTILELKRKDRELYYTVVILRQIKEIHD